MIINAQELYDLIRIALDSMGVFKKNMDQMTVVIEGNLMIFKHANQEYRITVRQPENSKV